MLPPAFPKNDLKARWLIGIFSIVVFAAVVLLGQVEIKMELPFDVHVFARINAVINSMVAILLVAALQAIKKGNPLLHKRLMLSAMILSIVFLVSYILHHLLTGSTEYGGQGWIRTVYYFILITHVFLAAIILPFILFTAYRALIAEWPQHKKLARITWPVWFYVAVTGVVVYFMISPYYQ
jgi:putative membrane protein